MNDIIENTRSTIDSLDINNINQGTINSLKVIRKELDKIRNNMKRSSDSSSWKRKIKSSVEYFIYERLRDSPVDGLPEVQSLSNNEVLIRRYSKITDKQLREKDNIIFILETIKKLSEMNISHRAIHPKHFMFDTEKSIPIIIDFGKATFLGKKSNFYSRQPSYLSRNALMQNRSTLLDDIESFGYTLLYLFDNKILHTFSAKDDYIKDHENIKINFLKQYFTLLHLEVECHDEYINIFSENITDSDSDSEYFSAQF